MLTRESIDQETGVDQVERIGQLQRRDTWEINPDDRVPSVTNLRVSIIKRYTSSACCLNVVLLIALLCALTGLIYLIVAPTLTSSNLSAPVYASIFCGLVEGIGHEDGKATYLGIPYALPPTGQRRFRRPVELITPNICDQVWSHLNQSTNNPDAPHLVTKDRSPCMQLKPTTDTIVGSEDCLYLNIFIPKPSSEFELKPVVMIINGLFFMYGATHQLQISEGQQPHQDTVDQVDALHVTFNYRLGPLGFLTHPSTGEANLGLYDQLAALRWVRQNIRAFGGDPTRITLFGYGSGATSVLALFHSRMAQNLFDRVWISAPAIDQPRKTMEVALKESSRLLSCQIGSTGCSQDGLLIAPESIIRVWTWNHVKFHLENRLFSLPSPDEHGGINRTIFNPLEGVLINDGELVDASTWYQPTYPMPIVIGQTAYEAALYMTPLSLPLWDEPYFRRYAGHQLKLDTQQIDQLLISTRPERSDCPTRDSNNSTVIFDVTVHMASMVTDLRCTCPLGEVITQLIPKSMTIYRYYLRGLQRRFDPYAMTSFVSLAFHGWDAMLYLRGQLTHTDYARSTWPGGEGIKELDDSLNQMSDQLNKAMHAFSRTGQVPDWTEQSLHNSNMVNVIEQRKTACAATERVHLQRTQSLEDRCTIWQQWTNGNLKQFAWPA